MSIPDLDKLFIYRLDTPEDGTFFKDVYPEMPDKTFLLHHIGAIACFSDEAFFYYLPFFMTCLKEDPFGYDRLDIAINVHLQHLKAETREKYREEVEQAERDLGEIQRILGP